MKLSIHHYFLFLFLKHNFIYSYGLALRKREEVVVLNDKANYFKADSHDYA